MFGVAFFTSLSLLFRSRMKRVGCSLWLYPLMLALLQLLEKLSASTSTPTFPSPTLDIYSWSGDSVVLVCRAPKGHRGVQFTLYRDTKQMDMHEPQYGTEQVYFTVRMEEPDSGQHYLYCCLYKNQEGLYSLFSPYLQLKQKGVLPVPSLVLQPQTDVWHLLCTGSPAYPGSMFSLYVADNELPVATYHAKALQHQVTFPVPVQDSPVTFYQCQYTALLGSAWSTSKRSAPVALSTGMSPPSSKGVDWPLALGSFSAAVLFLCSLVFVVVLAKRKVKSAAEEKKRRQQAQFWTKVHAQDHIVDLTLRSTSFTSQVLFRLKALSRLPFRSSAAIINSRMPSTPAAFSSCW
ncbi:uncharacterized protein LOC124868043 isoform X2 [Girardinichthys multiradiatus]|uniref:uncharacterized protein LOC124868043 isoform X2 n=1 Tax=Girardinichthys multiradiatus TaxID=208333 RepID=UPI001FADA63E|nr:uncharacterized protein LOC124868043 isoform X2 [Girardinichthys multiradiatus]